MSNQLHKLSSLAISKLKKLERYSNGGCLYLRIQQGVKGHISKYWVFRYEKDNKERLLGLDPLHTISLAETREKALQYQNCYWKVLTLKLIKKKNT